jgi:hypothetical protein
MPRSSLLRSITPDESPTIYDPSTTRPNRTTRRHDASVRCPTRPCTRQPPQAARPGPDSASERAATRVSKSFIAGVVRLSQTRQRRGQGNSSRCQGRQPQPDEATTVETPASPSPCRRSMVFVFAITLHDEPTEMQFMKSRGRRARSVWSWRERFSYRNGTGSDRVLATLFPLPVTTIEFAAPILGPVLPTAHFSNADRETAGRPHTP